MTQLSVYVGELWNQFGVYSSIVNMLLRFGKEFDYRWVMMPLDAIFRI